MGNMKTSSVSGWGSHMTSVISSRILGTEWPLTSYLNLIYFCVVLLFLWQSDPHDTSQPISSLVSNLALSLTRRDFFFLISCISSTHNTIGWWSRYFTSFSGHWVSLEVTPVRRLDIKLWKLLQTSICVNDGVVLSFTAVGYYYYSYLS